MSGPVESGIPCLVISAAVVVFSIFFVAGVLA